MLQQHMTSMIHLAHGPTVQDLYDPHLAPHDPTVHDLYDSHLAHDPSVQDLYDPHLAPREPTVLFQLMVFMILL